MKTRVVDRTHAPFQLVIRRSRIHRLGVFAGEAIPPRCKVIEFTGERITFEEARRRWSPTLNYLFGLDDNLLIDGAAGGSGAEYVNHSCAPHLHARILRGHLLYFSSRAIEKGEELTVDYKYAGGGKQTHPCKCGAPACRGTLILARRDTRGSRAPRFGSSHPYQRQTVIRRQLAALDARGPGREIFGHLPRACHRLVVHSSYERVCDPAGAFGVIVMFPRPGVLLRRKIPSSSLPES